MGRQRDDSEDAELWEKVARTARPLKKGRAASGGEQPKASARAPRKEPAPKFAFKTPVSPAPTPRSATLDRQTARKLERGAVMVEARLDLHGMRQKEAHAVLRRFLKSAQGKGYRHVLVITGKGAETEARRSFYEEERGVLRASVPHWLAAPDLAPLIVSFAEAPRRLGGEGALYVRLRRPTK